MAKLEFEAFDVDGDDKLTRSGEYLNTEWIKNVTLMRCTATPPSNGQSGSQLAKCTRESVGIGGGTVRSLGVFVVSFFLLTSVT